MAEPTGVFYPDGSFHNRIEICSRLAEQAQVHRVTDDPAVKDFQWWQEVAIRRQAERQEVLGIPAYVKIEITAQRCIGIANIGDVHEGGDRVDYEFFGRTVEQIKSTKNVYCNLLGDLADSFFFIPAVHEALMNLSEQYEYLRAALNELKGKILGAWGGNHDLWASRMGPTMYQDFTKNFNAYYFEGMSCEDIILNGISYKLVGSHTHNGFSLWNHSHASIRLRNDEAIDGDIFITAHKHVKGQSTQYVAFADGKVKPVFYSSIGTFKATDSFSRSKGLHVQKREEMGGDGYILFPDRRIIEQCRTVQEMCAKVELYSTLDHCPFDEP